MQNARLCLLLLAVIPLAALRYREVGDWGELVVASLAAVLAGLVHVALAYLIREWGNNESGK
jgi:hypothetical protein